MKRLSPTVLLFTAIVAFTAILVVEGAWLRHEQQVAKRAQAALRRKTQERDTLLAQSPALNGANEQAIADDLVRAQRVIGEGRAGLPPAQARRPTEAAPTRTIEAFFDIARFVERSRAAAGNAKVALRPDERFGFAAYTNEGPAVDVLPQVHHQCLVSESLIGQLLAAHPRALLGLRREAVGPVQPAARNQTEDFFVMDRALSLRQPGDVDTMAFRVEFSGQTATLRNFLTGLADLPQPLLVRSVEVEPWPGTAVAATANGPETPVPLVRQNLSKFSVVVESVLLASTAAKVAP